MAVDSGPAGFLAELEPAEAEDLLGAGRQRRYETGTALFHQGDDAGTVLVLESGRVKVTALGEGGREVVLGFCGPGELLGEVSAIDGEPRSGTVTALEPVEVRAITGGDFRRFLERHPRVTEILLRSVISRLRLADRQRIDFASLDVTGRVARSLTELADTHGERVEGGVRITLPISQEELAGWTGASREAVAKSLHLLRRLRWITTDRRSITLLDIGELRRHST
jgi:CRP/FNR family transcriptional regulator, cyclic AMP receptor protein